MYQRAQKRRKTRLFLAFFLGFASGPLARVTFVAACFSRASMDSCGACAKTAPAAGRLAFSSARMALQPYDRMTHDLHIGYTKAAVADSGRIRFIRGSRNPLQYGVSRALESGWISDSKNSSQAGSCRIAFDACARRPELSDQSDLP
jgi:hypothetical protein